MNALVTGGGGFLGRHIVMKLLARGDRVRILGRRSYPDWEARAVETLSADLQDKAAVEHACLGMDAVFHVAALAGYWGPWEAYYGPNVVGTENVLFFFSSRRRHTRLQGDWSSDVCSSD